MYKQLPVRVAQKENPGSALSVFCLIADAFVGISGLQCKIQKENVTCVHATWMHVFFLSFFLMQIGSVISTINKNMREAARKFLMWTPWQISRQEEKHQSQFDCSGLITDLFRFELCSMLSDMEDIQIYKLPLPSEATHGCCHADEESSSHVCPEDCW